MQAAEGCVFAFGSKHGVGTGARHSETPVQSAEVVQAGLLYCHSSHSPVFAFCRTHCELVCAGPTLSLSLPPVESMLTPSDNLRPVFTSTSYVPGTMPGSAEPRIAVMAAAVLVI